MLPIVSACAGFLHLAIKDWNWGIPSRTSLWRNRFWDERGLSMGSDLARASQYHDRDHIESELRQRDLWLHEIAEDRIRLALRLTENRALHRMISRRRYRSLSIARRTCPRYRRVA
jgi:hypothetical protein